MAHNELPEDIKTVIMMDLRTPDPNKETREAVMAHVERKRRRPITAMEIGNHENDYNENAGDWWGGDVNEDNYGDNEEHYHQEVNYSGYGSKGYGLKGEGTTTWRRGRANVSEKEEDVERLAALTKAVARAKEAKAKEVRKGSSKELVTGVESGVTRRADAATRTPTWSASAPTNHSKETAKETYNLQNDDEEVWRTVGGPLSSLDKAPRFVHVCSLHANYRKNFTQAAEPVRLLERDSGRRPGRGEREVAGLNVCSLHANYHKNFTQAAEPVRLLERDSGRRPGRGEREVAG